MSLKNVLGTMLASRMAGRGRRGGGLGTAAMAGMLGGRGRGMGGKLGMAALGYMAYQAYRDHQSRAGAGTGGFTSGATGGTGGTGGATPGGLQGGMGGIGGMLQDVADRLTGGRTSPAASQPAAGAAPPFSPEDEQAAERFSDETALLLIRAMVTAAYSDGALSQDERGRIMQEIQSGNADAEDRRTMEREIANPRPLDELLGQVRGQEISQQFYFASRAAIDGASEANRTYLQTLSQRLGLSEQEAAEVEDLAS